LLDGWTTITPRRR